MAGASDDLRDRAVDERRAPFDDENIVVASSFVLAVECGLGTDMTSNWNPRRDETGPCQDFEAFQGCRL